MLAMLLCALMSMPADVLTVDDTGGAQFTSIQAAIDAAMPGDVVLVADGNYEAFSLSKFLSILGPAAGPRPRVAGTSVVADTHAFTIAGLEFAGLSLTTIAGRGMLDDCSVGVWAPTSETAALSANDCHQLIVTRCSVLGGENSGGVGASFTNSVVTLAADSFTGGYGYSPGAGGEGGNGGSAVMIHFGSAMIAACTLLGGDAGVGFLFLNPFIGRAGDGLDVKEATVLVRGPSTNSINAGYSYPPDGTPAFDLSLTSNATLVVSGVKYHAVAVSVAPGSVLLKPPMPEPYLSLAGAGPSGAAAQLLVGGPHAPALLLGSVQPMLLSLAKLEQPLWLALGTLPLVPLTTFGGETPLAFDVDLPADPQLLGVEVVVQVVFPGVASTLAPGTKVVTNPAILVPRS